MSNIDRVRLALQLTQAKEAVSSGNKDVNKELERDELKKVTMEHPYVSGKTVKAVYFSELFINYGHTIADWLEANWIKKSVHNAEVARLNARISELESKTVSAPPVIKKG